MFQSLLFGFVNSLNRWSYSLGVITGSLSISAALSSDDRLLRLFLKHDWCQYSYRHCCLPPLLHGDVGWWRSLHTDDNEMFVAVNSVRGEDMRGGVGHLGGQAHPQWRVRPPLVTGAWHWGGLRHSPHWAWPVPVGLDRPDRADNDCQNCWLTLTSESCWGHFLH